MKLEVGGAKILSGQALNRIPTLAGSGGSREFRWLVLISEGTKAITLDVSCPKGGIGPEGNRPAGQGLRPPRRIVMPGMTLPSG